MLTIEQKMALCEDYKNRNNTVTELQKKYGISRSHVARIAVEMGADPRKPRSYGKRNGGKSKICPKCKKTIETKGARFCCFCGSDIRTGREICVAKLEKLMTHIMLIPSTMRDEFTQTINETIKELTAE